jgi:hypothetical protein
MNESLVESKTKTSEIISKLLLASFLSVGVFGFVLMQLFPFFPKPDLPPLTVGSSPELIAQHHSAEYDFWAKNAPVYFGSVSGVFGFLLVFVRSRGSKVKHALAAALFAFAGASIASWIIGRFVAQGVIESSTQSLQELIAHHSVPWSVGIACALAAVTFTWQDFTRPVTAAIVGLVTGVAIAVCYVILLPYVSDQLSPRFLIPQTIVGKGLLVALAVPITAAGSIVAMQSEK